MCRGTKYMAHVGSKRKFSMPLGSARPMHPRSRRIFPESFNNTADVSNSTQ